jgi:hypothetical protein
MGWTPAIFKKAVQNAVDGILCLSNKGMTDKDLKQVLNELALRPQSDTHTIDLSHNLLTSVAIKLLVEQLPSSVNSVNLEHNYIADCDELDVLCKKVAKLCLFDNDLDSDSLKRLGSNDSAVIVSAEL